jgi:ubiquinone/menaquinone biosynthesis C-methylase UbiE
MNKKEFDTFFKSYSKNVDQANNSAFWKLSDHLILDIIKDNIPMDLKKGATIFDAGGGTGRWVCMLSDYYKSNFIIYDLSEDMLDVAKKNITKKNLEKRVAIINGDLANIDKIDDGSVDFIISIYSPISFITEKEKTAKELFRILRKGGKIIIMGHSYFNAIGSKINDYIAPKEELLKLEEESVVKWAPYVPELNVFSKESMEKLLRDGGFIIKKTYGVPSFVRPGPEDWDPENKQKSKISLALEKDDFYEAVYMVERKYGSDETVSNRGMNIITVAQK